MAIEAGEQSDLVELTTRIVTAYAAGNHLPATELPGLIQGVHASIQGLTSGNAKAAEKQRVLTSAEIRRSIQPSGLVSFEDGKAYKTLRRHLARLGLTPEAYRAKWGLSVDYPMTASDYSAQRSQFARDLGLGKSRSATPEAPSPAADEASVDTDEHSADAGQSATQEPIPEPDREDVGDAFKEEITREPVDEDRVKP